MAIEDRCPCGRSLADEVADALRRNAICSDALQARKDLERDLEHRELIFDCYRRDRNAPRGPLREKPRTAELVTARERMCDYRYAIFRSREQAIQFYNDSTVDVGERRIERLRRSSGLDGGIYLVRFVDRISPLVIGTLDGFIEHENLALLAGGLSSYIGLATTIVPRFQGRIAVPHTRQHWNVFCRLMRSLKLAQHLCGDCAWEAADSISSLSDRSEVLGSAEVVEHRCAKWCGSRQIVVPIMVNGRWVGSAVSGGLFDSQAAFDTLRKTLEENRLVDRFHDEIRSIDLRKMVREGDPLRETTTADDTLRGARFLYEQDVQTGIRALDRLDEYKRRARAAVATVTASLEERYSSVRRRKNAYWLQKLGHEWKEPDDGGGDLWDRAYELVQITADFGLFEKTYLLLSSSKRSSAYRGPYSFRWVGKPHRRPFEIAETSPYRSTLFNEPMEIHLWAPDLSQPPEERRLPDPKRRGNALVHALLGELMSDDETELNETPDFVAVLPVAVSREDFRFCLVVFVGRKVARPAYSKGVYEYVHTLCHGVRRFLEGALKDGYEKRKRMESYKAQTTFLNFLDHELVQTLAYWQGSMEWIQKEVGRVLGHSIKGTVAKRFEDQRRQARQLSALVSDLAAINLLDEGSIRVAPERCSFEKLVQQAAHLYAETASRKGIRFDFKLSIRVPVSVDPSLIERVIGNLVRNAVAYGYDDSDIVFDCLPQTSASALWEFTITNIGIGVEPGWEERIFERGIRSPGAERYSSGTGYGLWLARELMRAHGPGFDLQFRRDEHSRNRVTFVIVVPRVQGQLRTRTW